MKLQSLNLKFLIKAHTKIGLFALFFFYLSAFFGTITLFLPQIQQWESPSRYFIEGKSIEHKLNKLIYRVIQEEGFSTNKIEIILPSYRDNIISINDSTSRTKYVNPYTLKMLDTTEDRAFLSRFFNDIHVGRNIPKLGQLLMGISSILIIFLIITGVILFFNKHKAKKTFNFKWHRDISLLLLPYIIVFALTGSALGFMLGNSSAFAYSSTKTENSNMRELLSPIIFPKQKVPLKSYAVEMKNIDELKQTAQEHYYNLKIKKITLLQWYDKNAQIKFSGFLTDNRALSGKVNRQYIILNGNSGEVIEKKELSNTHLGNKFLSIFYFLHFIPDETLLVRLIYLVLGIAFLGSLIFGFLIWSQKKAALFKDNFEYYNFLSRFSLSIMAGIIPSTALLLLLFWATPSELFQRIIWIKGSFYAFWAFTLVIGVYFDEIIDLLKSYFFLTSFFLFSTVLAHMIRVKEKLALLVQSDQWHTVLSFDLILVILSVFFFLLYKYLGKINWIVKYTRRGYGG